MVWLLVSVVQMVAFEQQPFGQLQYLHPKHRKEQSKPRDRPSHRLRMTCFVRAALTSS